ncbi:PHP-associated domain-containing protein [Breznakiellaceae bacterium SP9]
MSEVCKPFLYETHLHTCQASACAAAYGHEYIQAYIDKGYTGIIVTEHFYNGNSSVSRHIPWRQWVDAFCRGYEDAFNEGLRRGLDVFFGWEETFRGDDYLVYGLDKAWLLAHPEAKHWDLKTQYQTVKEYGGCVVHAHPFRQHYYINGIFLSPYLVDAVEVANAGNHESSYDALALLYAQKLGLPLTAGSDIHYREQIDSNNIFGVYSKTRFSSIADFVEAIRTNSLAGLSISPGRCDSGGYDSLQHEVHLPVFIRDKNERVISRDLGDFLEQLEQKNNKEGTCKIRYSRFPNE